MIDGNICRCTGYKSIERAAQQLSEQISKKPSQQNMEWLIEHKYLPAYFSGIEERLKSIIPSFSKSESALNIGGGTDLNVQKHHLVKKSSINNLFDDEKLKGVSEIHNQIVIAASATVNDFAESIIIKNIFPKLEQHIKLVSSTPIRNMATIAGNLVNASPIGDMTVFLLALNAEIVFNTGDK